MDPSTDALIQRTISSEFSDRTVLTIAHRLNTIINSNRIMVLDAGQIVEFASGEELIKNKDSVLRGMIDESKDRKQLYRALGEEKQAIETRCEFPKQATQF